MQKIKSFILAYVSSSTGKELLETFVKYLIKKLFKNATFGGLKSWLIKIFVKEIMLDKALIPVIKKVFNQLGFSYDVHAGSILIKRLRIASETNNETDYNNTTDDIFS